jgi:hypothetical protein
MGANSSMRPDRALDIDFHLAGTKLVQALLVGAWLVSGSLGIAGRLHAQERGTTPPHASDAFKAGLDKVLLSARDNFKSLIVRPPRSDREYAAKVNLPGFESCEVNENDDGKRQYGCVLTSSPRLTPAMHRAYDDLIAHVGRATSAVSSPFVLLPGKAETYPGSGVYSAYQGQQFCTEDGISVQVELEPDNPLLGAHLWEVKLDVEQGVGCKEVASPARCRTLFLTATKTRSPSATVVCVQVDPDVLSLRVGQSEQLRAFEVYSDGTSQDISGTVEWISSDARVAVVNNFQGSSHGFVSAIGPGTATLTPTYGAAYRLKGSATMTVSPTP